MGVNNYSLTSKFPTLFVFLLIQILKFVMAHGSKVSERERGIIQAYKEMNKANRWIARKIGRSPKVVNNFVKVHHFSRLFYVLH